VAAFVTGLALVGALAVGWFIRPLAGVPPDGSQSAISSTEPWPATALRSELGAPIEAATGDLTGVVAPIASDDAPTEANVTACIVRPAPDEECFEIGRSAQGRPIQAVRLGSGEIRLALMGSIHGGWERNTERLVSLMHEHFRAHPVEIPRGLAVYFVPTTNPDGIEMGSGPEAAWNARGVDLNRNFDTPNWSPDAFGRVGGRYGPSGMRRGAGGAAPFSEPETQAIAGFIRGHAITVVISYHSGIVSVTDKDGGGIAAGLAQHAAAITGYPYIATWTEYRLTGQFMDWLDSVGVYGIEIDLPDQQTTDWDKNLAAVKAVMGLISGIPAGV